MRLPLATKAARKCGAARGEPVLKFGPRRAQGVDADRLLEQGLSKKLQTPKCDGCGCRVQGRHELQTSDAVGAAGVQLGPNAHAAKLHLMIEQLTENEKQHPGNERLAKFLWSHLDSLFTFLETTDSRCYQLAWRASDTTCRSQPESLGRKPNA